VTTISETCFELVPSVCVCVCVCVCMCACVCVCVCVCPYHTKLSSLCRNALFKALLSCTRKGGEGKGGREGGGGSEGEGPGVDMSVPWYIRYLSLSMTALTTSCRPFCSASCTKEVSLRLRTISAPRDSMSTTAVTWPSLAAMCSAVFCTQRNHNQKSEIRNQKSEIRNQKQKQKSESVYCQVVFTDKECAFLNWCITLNIKRKAII